jgi:hypothetical protein
MGKPNQIDQILVESPRYSNVLDVRLFGASDCDTDHYLVVARVRKGLEAYEEVQYQEVKQGRG